MFCPKALQGALQGFSFHEYSLATGFLQGLYALEGKNQQYFFDV